MHIVFLNQYYPPDAAPTGVMLKAVAERLVADGHEVTVICAHGGYAGADGSAPQPVADEPAAGGPRVVRLRATRFGRGSFLGKLADYFSFYTQVQWQLLRTARVDRIVALTTPPYLSLLARCYSWLRGGDHAHWVMDLYPDVMVAHGMLKDGSPGHHLLAWLARLGFGGRRCAGVVTLGPDMHARVDHYLPAATAHAWVPLWGSHPAEGQEAEEAERAAARLRRDRGWSPNELVVMYSGNIGLGHRFSEVFAAASALAHERIRFVVFGRGKRRAEVVNFIDQHPHCRIELHDYAPADLLATHLQSADVQLASLDPAWSGTMVPSKLQGIFAVGRPVIFIGDAHSSIGQWVRQAHAGWVVPPDDPKALVAAIHAAQDPAEREFRGQAAATFAATHFDKTTNVALIARLLTEGGRVFQPANKA